MARVFAPSAFRYHNIDYRYGWQDMADSLADTMVGAGLVTFSDNFVDSAGIWTILQDIVSIINNPDGTISSVVTSSATYTYTYSNGAISTISDGSQTQTFNWVNGQLSSVTVA